MKQILRVLTVLAIIAAPGSFAHATGWRKIGNDVEILNRKLKGKVVDYTANHGTDNRIWSRALGQRRDMYVYLPPGYDASCKYPIVIFLHGFAMDETGFLDFVPWIDEAMATCKIAPFIMVSPDGSLQGEACHKHPATFFLNSNLGDFEDYVLQDVWDFMVTRYPIRPEREAHVLVGVSMGGMAAYSIALRHREAFGVVVGLHPPLNMRWMNDQGDYMANFDPHHWGWRTTLDRRHEVVARFYGGLVSLRINQFVDPIFGGGDQALYEVSQHNPIELIDRTRLRNCDLKMYVAFGGKDEFNFDAQCESFLYWCKFRNIEVGVGYDPEGRHDIRSAYRQFPAIVHWLAPIIRPYSPVNQEHVMNVVSTLPTQEEWALAHPELHKAPLANPEAANPVMQASSPNGPGDVTPASEPPPGVSPSASPYQRPTMLGNYLRMGSPKMRVIPR